MEARGVLGAENGGLELSIGNETIELGKTPEEVASKLKDIKDLDLDDLYASSSVDFADEYGFENEDDAHELFDKAVALLVPRDESVNEAVGEYTYTLEYNGEGASGYSKHILTITNPEGESKVVADDFTYFEPEEQDMQAELESWFKYGHGVGDEPQESIDEEIKVGDMVKSKGGVEGTVTKVDKDRGRVDVKPSKPITKKREYFNNYKIDDVERIEEGQNCGCGKNPCETYGKVEETADKAMQAAIQELRSLAGI